MSGPYNITKTDGTSVPITQGVVDTSRYDIALIGQNYTGYGSYLNQNELRMLENFASASAPAHPTKGQIWYDSGNNLPKVYTGSTWKNIGSATAASSAPAGANQGDLWYDTINKQMKAYNGTSWDLVGPDYTVLQGLAGQQVNTVLDNASGSHVVVYIYAGGNIVAIFSGEGSAFTPNTPITGFATIQPGLNLNSTLNAKVANADLLDGLDSTQFMRSDTNTGTSGNLAITNSTASTNSTTGALKVTDALGRVASTTSKLLQSPINPAVEILFANTLVRQFTFEVLMAPRNEKESINMHSIIKTLRFHGAPEISDFSSLFWIPPAEFDITFFHRGVENMNILRINTCVLERIEVDYAPTGVYSTFRNGHPVVTRMSMGFRELEPIHKKRVLQGF